MNPARWNAWARRQPAVFALVLLLLSLAINLFFQPNMFSRDILNSNMRVFLPIVLMAVGQAIVILGGGIDISVGVLVSIMNTVLAICVGLDASPEKMWQLIFILLLIGLLSGVDDGLLIA